MKIGTHYLTNDNGDLIAELKNFDATNMKNSIVQYLSENKNETLYLCVSKGKEPSEGDTILNTFECNPRTGKPSVRTQKGRSARYETL